MVIRVLGVFFEHCFSKQQLLVLVTQCPPSQQGCSRCAEHPGGGAGGSPVGDQTASLPPDTKGQPLPSCRELPDSSCLCFPPLQKMLVFTRLIFMP